MDLAILRCCRSLLLVAQEGGVGGAARPDSGAWLIQLMPFIAIGAIFYFLLIRPQQRERARHRSMLDALKKNDRVLTAGGIYGVVTNVHREADEVTLKVDEATNTKLRVTLSSIARVLGGEPTEDSSTK